MQNAPLPSHTPIFSESALRAYAECRLFGENASADAVDCIELHNGLLPSELRARLESTGAPFLPVKQRNGREPLYLQGRTLHIPQYSGFARRHRYEDLISQYRSLRESIQWESKDRDGQPRKTNIAYDNFAYDLMKEIFAKDPDGFDAVVFGNVHALLADRPIIWRLENEYLDVALLAHGSRRILLFGYVYADQAGTLIDKMLRELEARARITTVHRTESVPRADRQHIDIFFVGRVGALAVGMSRNALVFPTAIIDEHDLRDGRHLLYPIHNTLAHGLPPGAHTGTQLNVTSVVHETRELLEAARLVGCVSVDMEVRELVESVNRARRRYARVLTIGFGFVGYVSDRPLDGDTLATELDSDEGERAAIEQLFTRGLI